MQIILIGLRASGKTAVGREIAEQLWSDFRDLDDVTLEAFPKLSVTDVFEQRGEAAWRAAELEALQQTAPRDEGVLALGGGTAMIDAKLARSSRAGARRGR
jgi:shikimate kinase